MKNKIILAAICLLSFTACTNEDIVESSADVVNIVTEIEPSKDSRISIREDGRGSFTSGDQISLYTNGYSKRTLTFNNNTWTPELSWSEIGTGQVNFLSYYPANPFTYYNGFNCVRVEVDQSKSNAFEKSDLLIAKTTVHSGEKVRLNFKHAMSRLTVKLGSNFLTPSDLAKAQIKIWSFPYMEMDERTGTFKRDRGGTSQIIMRHLKEGTYQAIVCPHPIFDEWHNTQWMTISINGTTYTYLAPKKLSNNQSFDQFESGKEVILNININKKDIEENWPTDVNQVDWRNKTMWVYGLKNIPTTDKWGWYFNNQYNIIGLEWQRDYGWYDCTKIDPVDPYSPSHDSNLCWAAACSNLIYWWLDQNADYIQRYGYNGPMVYKDAFDCGVFQYFKDHFTNHGLFIQSGMNWFFKGIKPPYNGDDVASLRPNKNHTGFFKDVFENTTLLRMASGRTLSEDLKQAYINKEAIGLSIILKAGLAGHAINIWGAEFDANGEVCKLYITENNDNEEARQGISPMQPGKLCPAGIFPKKVIKKADDEYWMESSTQGQYTILINDLVYLSPHHQAWENYFKNHPEK